MGIKFNLGCGEKYLPGYVNCDVSPRVKADHYFDLDRPPYPFEGGCAEEILMDQVLEHLGDIPQIMEELHRLLQTGGLLRIYVPYGKTDWAIQDPTHRHFFTEKSMDYFCSGYPCSYYSAARFNLNEARLYCNRTNFMHTLRNLLPLKRYLKYFLFNIYDGIYFELQRV